MKGIKASFSDVFLFLVRRKRRRKKVKIMCIEYMSIFCWNLFVTINSNFVKYLISNILWLILSCIYISIDAWTTSRISQFVALFWINKMVFKVLDDENWSKLAFKDFVYHFLVMGHTYKKSGLAFSETNVHSQNWETHLLFLISLKFT